MNPMDSDDQPEARKVWHKPAMKAWNKPEIRDQSIPSLTEASPGTGS